MESVFKLVLATAGATTVTTALAAVHSSLAGLAGIATTVTGSLAGVKSALNIGADLEHLSRRTGQSVLDLAKLQASFKLAGLSADQVAPSLARLHKAIDTAVNSDRTGDVKRLAREFKGLDEEGYAAADAFARLGLSADALKQMPAQAQFEALAGAFARLPSPVERSALAMKLFGRSGAELIQLFARENVFDLADSATRLAHRLDETAPRFERVNRGLGAINSRLREMWLTAAESALPALEKVAGITKSLNLAPAGAAIGATMDGLLPMLALAAAAPLDKLVDKWAMAAAVKTKSELVLQVGSAVQGFTGALARVMPIGLGLFVAAELVTGIYAAYAEARRQRVADAGYFATDKVSPAIRESGQIRDEGGRTASVEKLEKLKKELQGRFFDEAIRWFPDKTVLESYRSQLGNINHALEELGTSWATVRMQQNLATDKAAEFARRENAAAEWLKSAEALRAREKIAESISAHRDQEDLLKNQQAMLALQDTSVGIFARIRSARALTKQEEMELLRLESQRADLLKEIETTERNVAQTRANFAQNVLEGHLERSAAARARIDGDFSRTEAEKWSERKRLLEVELQARQSYLEQQKSIRGLASTDAGRAQGDANVRGAQKDVSATQQSLATLGPDPNSYAAQTDNALARLRENWGTTAQNVAGVVSGTLNSALQGTAGLIENLWLRTKTWGEAWRGMLIGVGQQFSQMISEMVAKLIFKHTLEVALIRLGLMHDTAATATKVGTHAAGEGAKTGATLLGTVTRKGLMLGETIFHALQVGLRTAAHIVGEVLRTAATILQSGLRIAAIIGESIAYVIQAAAGALAAMSSIPWVGPILAVGAMAAILAAGMSLVKGFADGGYTARGNHGEPAGVVHKGEWVAPKWMLENPAYAPVIASLESARQGRPGYKFGGFVGEILQPWNAFAIDPKHPFFFKSQSLINDQIKSAFSFSGGVAAPSSDAPRATYVAPDTAQTQRDSVATLLRYMSSDGGSANAGGAGSGRGSTKIIFVSDMRAAMREAQRAPGEEARIVDIMRRNKGDIFEL